MIKIATLNNGKYPNLKTTLHIEGCDCFTIFHSIVTRSCAVQKRSMTSHCSRLCFNYVQGKEQPWVHYGDCMFKRVHYRMFVKLYFEERLV